MSWIDKDVEIIEVLGTKCCDSKFDIGESHQRNRRSLSRWKQQGDSLILRNVQKPKYLKKIATTKVLNIKAIIRWSEEVSKRQWLAEYVVML